MHLPHNAPLTARDRRRRRLTVLFWAAQVLLLLTALAFRLASPSAIMTPLHVFKPGLVSPSNVCVTVNGRLADIAQTSRADKPALAARIAGLDAYLSSVLARLPREQDARFPPEFVSNVQTLKRVCERWRRLKPDADASVDMQAEFLSYRSRFRDVLRRIPKPAPLWYLHAVRASTGLLEGVFSPALVPWRAGALALNGRLSLRAVLKPDDWRHAGLVFVLSLFYGGLLCIYLCAWLALRFRHLVLYVPGLFAVLYGAGHVVYAVAQFF